MSDTSLYATEYCELALAWNTIQNVKAGLPVEVYARINGVLSELDGVLHDLKREEPGLPTPLFNKNCDHCTGRTCGD